MVNSFTIKYSDISKKLISGVHILSRLTNIKSNELVALWDTGATTSCISTSIAKKLNLIPTGKMKIMTPSGDSVQSTYLVDLLLPNKVVVKNLLVCDSSIGNQQIDVLIGMDVITLGDFAVSNFKNKTHFSYRYPSKKHCDF